MIDRLALIVLLAGCVLFAAIIAAEITATPAARTEIAAWRSPTRAEPLPPTARAERGPRSEAMVAEILARPLFSATRRPPAKNENPTVDSGLADTRLAGIVTTPGRRLAIFVPNGAKPLVVNEGDTISGWHIDRITPREVSLTGPTGTKTLQPKIDPTLVPPAPPTTAAPPPLGSKPNNPAFAPPTRPGFPSPPANRLPIRPGQRREPL
jgi:general secretion pathway protein N